MAEGGTKSTNNEEHIKRQNYEEQRDEVLVLQSVYESGVNSFQILYSREGPQDDGLFSLFITIPVQPFDDEVSVITGSYPVEARAEANGEKTAVEHKNGSSLKVKYLPPLNLQVVLPPTYPSHDAPEVSISCCWLTTNQILALRGHLEELWEKAQCAPVIFTWLDWLENNLVSFLSIEDHVVISTAHEDADPREKDRTTDMAETLNIIRQYNIRQESAEFRKCMHECPVCCEEFPGRKLHRLDNCGHFLCDECMSSFCLHHVTAGTVESIRCPDTECDSIIPPHIVQSVLPADEFHRWERLMLQKTLESMTDMEWCPRCNNPVIREAEENLNLGHCITCFFSFCTECRDPWHQGRSCITTADKLAAVSAGVDPEYDWEKFGEQRRKLEEEFRSELSMQEKVKKCPSCHIKIEKINGCNRMVCKCGTMFCWLCLSVIEGYNHFQMGASLCRLSDLKDLEHVVMDITPENIGYVERLIRPKNLMGNQIQTQKGRRHRLPDNTTPCPSCKLRNWKMSHNNHIKCRGCSVNYCFICREKIQGVVTSHFTPQGCPQHS